METEPVIERGTTGIKPTHVRWGILAMLFVITTINYADRATDLARRSGAEESVGLVAGRDGYVFSAFAWMIMCNCVSADWLVVAIISLAFFGKGVGALGWAAVSDTSPKEAGGLSGALFNTFGNVAGITTPVVIGYILQASGSFAGALIYIGANAAAAILCYLVLVGEIKRFEFKAPMVQPDVIPPPSAAHAVCK